MYKVRDLQCIDVNKLLRARRLRDRHYGIGVARGIHTATPGQEPREIERSRAAEHFTERRYRVCKRTLVIQLISSVTFRHVTLGVHSPLVEEKLQSEKEAMEKIKDMQRLTNDVSMTCLGFNLDFC